MIEIDMPLPSSCDECFALDDHGDYPYCLISHDQRGYTFNTRANRMQSCPLKEQERTIVDLRNVLQLIADIAYDYDGYDTIEGLKSLIDEIREMALQGVPNE